MKIYTRRGDGGTTSLYSGERVPKNSLVIDVLGAVDESQAVLGAARAECEGDGALDALLVGIERDLWIAMAEIATSPGVSAEGRDAHERPKVTAAMIGDLEAKIDAAVERAGPQGGFAVPGESRLSACFDVARTVVRRAERLAVGLDRPDSLLVTYLNRLSDLCWALARA
ncbi:MAG TPA: cob(I)yrinic acid a,c-diamide adenosyltransferase, partial [Acidimicrobiales bacterium]|nr:cob(I)yrinic acid a,c-diamide adenosyltransferase [Acidimicrobiales bacterium]